MHRYAFKSSHFDRSGFRPATRAVVSLMYGLHLIITCFNDEGKHRLSEKIKSFEDR